MAGAYCVFVVFCPFVHLYTLILIKKCLTWFQINYARCFTLLLEPPVAYFHQRHIQLKIFRLSNFKMNRAIWLYNNFLNPLPSLRPWFYFPFFVFSLFSNIKFKIFKSNFKQNYIIVRSVQMNHIFFYLDLFCETLTLLLLILYLQYDLNIIIKYNKIII